MARTCRVGKERFCSTLKEEKISWPKASENLELGESLNQKEFVIKLYEWIKVVTLNPIS